MQESSVNLPPLVASTQLISCANGLKFKTVAVTVYGTLLSLTSGHHLILTVKTLLIPLLPYK